MNALVAVAAVIAMFALAPGVASADEDEHREKWIEKYDTDGDGELSEAEREAARADTAEKREVRKADLLAKYDADGDGRLSREERKAARDAGDLEKRGGGRRNGERRRGGRRGY